MASPFFVRGSGIRLQYGYNMDISYLCCCFSPHIEIYGIYFSKARSKNIVFNKPLFTYGEIASLSSQKYP